MIDYIEGRDNVTTEGDHHESSIFNLFTKPKGGSPIPISNERLAYYAELCGVIRVPIDGGVKIYYDGNTITKNIPLILKALLEDFGIHLGDLPTDMSSLYKREEPVADSSNLKVNNTKVSTKELAYFGKSIVTGDFNGDGVKEVFIGAPGYSVPGVSEQGAVYLTNINLTDDINYASPHLTLEGEVYTRFGYSMEVLDINHDGIDDLVVSAPAYGHSNVT